MKWIQISKELPVEEGKYVVKTLTRMGNTHKIEVIYHGNGKWGVSNQIVIEWLKEK